MSPRKRVKLYAEDREGRWHLTFSEAGPAPAPRPPAYEPPAYHVLLEVLGDDKHDIDAYLAKACVDPQRRDARVPIQLLARFSALVGDVINHSWRAFPSEIMDAPLAEDNE